MLCFAYMGPLLILFTTHGLLGMAVISYAFAYDFLTVPWRLMTGHMADFWVAVPIFTAALLWTCLPLAAISTAFHGFFHSLSWLPVPFQAVCHAVCDVLSLGGRSAT